MKKRDNLDELRQMRLRRTMIPSDNEILRFATIALTAMQKEYGADHKFPPDAIWEHFPPNTSIPSTSKPAHVRRLIKARLLEPTGGKTRAQSGSRAGSTTNEYRFGSVFASQILSPTKLEPIGSSSLGADGKKASKERQSATRVRRIYSVAGELLQKSREAALAAVQIYNNPQIGFKSELFIVTMNIAWTYLLHAYYRRSGVEYRYFRMEGTKRKFDKTSHGAEKYWSLETCLQAERCPLDRGVNTNLFFLIGIRHEIEHQMTQKIDDLISAKFQASCLNYNEAIKKLFGENFGIEHHLTFSLQFSSITREQHDALSSAKGLPPHIFSFIDGFQGKLSEAEYNDPKFAYRVFFVAKTANRENQADEAIQFIKSDSEIAKTVNVKYAVIKETERKKFRPGTVVEVVQQAGFPKFRMHEHTLLWREKDAKNPSKGYGTMVEGVWFWYQSWIDEVLKVLNSRIPSS